MRARAILVAIALMMGACAPAPGDTTGDGWEGQGYGTATKVVIVDGVRCVLFDGSYAGGISCDWGNR